MLVRFFGGRLVIVGRSASLFGGRGGGGGGGVQNCLYLREKDKALQAMMLSQNKFTCSLVAISA